MNIRFNGADVDLKDESALATAIEARTQQALSATPDEALRAAAAAGFSSLTYFAIKVGGFAAYHAQHPERPVSVAVLQELATLLHQTVGLHYVQPPVEASEPANEIYMPPTPALEGEDLDS